MSSSSHPLLKDISNYKTGGSCLRLFEPQSRAELCENYREIQQNKWPFFLLGGGTNSLVLDTPWPGAVISFHKLKHVEVRGNRILSGAGVSNSDLCALALKEKLSGLEWMYRLPGQVGGTTRMNARCYGSEMSHVVDVVRGVSFDGTEETYQRSDGIFRGYKDTIFMTNGFLIAEVEIQLKRSSESSKMLEKMNFCESDRESKGHFAYPSCGCVFKNDYSPEVSVSSGLLLEQAGVKGLQRGKAAVSPKHANFIYNTGDASSSDILELALEMRERVWEHFGVWLEFEMELLGKIPENLRERVVEKRQPNYKRSLLAEIRAQFKTRLQS